jgi:pimeloyl-ACP methyl ester carboxylesterase
MAVVDVDGLQIAYEVIGEGRPWILTPGGRFPKETPGLRELADALAATGNKVVIWDRPNCGASSVCFTGASESEMQADALAGLLKALDLGPTMLVGGSGGARVSLLAAARHPEVARGLGMLWISGGLYGLLTLAMVYGFGSYLAAFTGTMADVADLAEWQEVQERNPANTGRLLAQDREEFLATIERWMAVYCPEPGTLIPGVGDAELQRFAVPTMVFRSGASDPHHTRATSENLAALLPGAALVEPPWGDHEWLDRVEASETAGEGLFARWPLLAPQLLEFEGSL